MLNLSRNTLVENPGRVFVFSYGGAEVKVRLRAAPKHKLVEIEARHTTTDVVAGIAISKVNEKAVQEDRYDYNIVDWEGIVMDGQPLPCTRENKLFLLQHFPPFAYFVNTTVTGMMSGSIVMTEEEEKNSSSSPGGTG
jgi:hypothetical protein